MKTYFDKEIVDKAIEHAKAEFPNESCGLIMNDDYYPMENLAENKITDFKIDTNQMIVNEDKIQCVIHSHIDYPHASKKDMMQQIATALPWGIINLSKYQGVTHIVFWGDQIEPQDLIGRPFFHGIYDCYGLVRDYHRTYIETIKQFPRENFWWETEPSMLVDYFPEAGFEEVDESEAREGDVVFFKIQAPVTNHCGIYLKNGLLLHHLYNKLSRREPIGSWKKYITHFVRYTGAK